MTGIHPTLARARRAERRSAAPSPRDAELARLARALANPARVAILRRLIASGERVCGEIVNGLPLAQATVSQHLKVLWDAGLIQGEVVGPRVCYRANQRAVRRIMELISGL